MGIKVFNGCEKLKNVRIDEENKYFQIKDGLILSRNGKTLVTCVIATENENELIIPSEVTKIGKYAFCDCANITSIKLPEGLTRIEDQAFGNCSGLTSIELPEGLTEIGNCAFNACRRLTSIELPEGLTKIGVGMFDRCTMLTSVKLPKSLTEIEYHTFAYCVSLTSVEVPKGVAKIGGGGAFENCRNLTLYVVEGSYTEQYAKENNIPFQLIKES